MSQWELAQLNIAQPVAPFDSPALADFVANLDRINALADKSSGFIWRLKGEAGDASGFNEPFGDDMVVNMSVWESVEALHEYVYQTAHIEVMRRRKDWFESVQSESAVLWWVPQGHIPDLFEAQAKLKLLGQTGPSQDAFTFKNRMHKPVE
ncbi:MAG: hypothetical protein ACI8VW_000325 [bacterium]|jgi:hypothetical protein